MEKEPFETETTDRDRHRAGTPGGVPSQPMLNHEPDRHRAVHSVRYSAVCGHDGEQRNRDECGGLCSAGVGCLRRFCLCAGRDLLRRNGKAAGRRGLHRHSKATRELRTAISVVYWLVVTAAFLLYTFGHKGNGQPQDSWFIWAIGGILYAALVLVVKMALRKQNNK